MSGYNPALSDLEQGIHGVGLDDVGLGTRATASRMGATPGAAPPNPLVTPIYTASIHPFKFTDMGKDKPLKYEGYDDGIYYARLRNPTREACEAIINALERGAGSLAFSSGSAAIVTILQTYLRAGDHIIAPKRVYSGTHYFLEHYVGPVMQVNISWIDPGKGIQEYERHIKPNTKIMYAETPCNPTMEITDLAELGKLGQSRGILTVVDSTFGSPFLQQPVLHGVDVSVHSCTKYMGGHSDLIGGCLTTRTLEQWRELKKKQIMFGNMLSPFDSSLLTRGLRTIHLRMERNSSNAQALAEMLEKHPKVSKVFYPGLKSHPGHEVAKKQMTAFSGMISFEVKGGLEGAKTIIKNIRLINVCVSLGGVESLMEHPATLTHAGTYSTPEEEIEAGINASLLRFSVGLEDLEDLKKDLQQALDKIEL